MSKVTMPEPAIQVDFDENGDAYIFAKATDEPIAKLTALGEGVCDVGQGFLTTTQAEAYADARVREALEEAARRIELLRDSHCADTALGGAKDACTPDGSNCDIVSAWNDSIEIVRALIPPH